MRIYVKRKKSDNFSSRKQGHSRKRSKHTKSPFEESRSPVVVYTYSVGVNVAKNTTSKVLGKSIAVVLSLLAVKQTWTRVIEHETEPSTKTQHRDDCVWWHCVWCVWCTDVLTCLMTVFDVLCLTCLTIVFDVFDVFDDCVWLLCLIDVFDWCIDWCVWLVCLIDVFDWCVWLRCLIDVFDVFDVFDWCIWLMRLMCLMTYCVWRVWWLCLMIVFDYVWRVWWLCLMIVFDYVWCVWWLRLTCLMYWRVDVFDVFNDCVWRVWCVWWLCLTCLMTAFNDCVSVSLCECVTKCVSEWVSVWVCDVWVCDCVTVWLCECVNVRVWVTVW